MQFSRWKTNDDGYITVASAGCAAIMISLLIVLAWQAGNLVAREQAQVAADVSAVAGAYVLARGELAAAACSVAQETALANDAEVENCTIEGEDLTLTINVRGQQAQAKAGPL
ncbi:hypothetical protein N24_0433 [Corynebacterium suranareeae]|uniref:Uncharacterized protein n=1 Tax=Corynebacterium suranareeae TaxID=2506452 RepID=A0A160PN66_9CORY|nr:Rv3654c family TadE-like protein [Corynebacterium suranareeae]BAU94695.1 hypothetical protein N24_0433 [Corynebacterium suranareeae]